MSVALWIKYGLIFVAVIAVVALILVALSRFRKPPKMCIRDRRPGGRGPAEDEDPGKLPENTDSLYQ